MEQAFALKHTEDVLKGSSSGGAFMAIAEAFLKITDNRGYVFGVCFDENMKLKYDGVSGISQCRKFCGSKYITPQLDSALKEVEYRLKRKDYVLFIGLPCHVNGMTHVLKKHDVNTERLYTVDLICNGAPSERVWIDFVKLLEHKYKGKLTDFHFRVKGSPSNPYKTKAYFENGKTVIDTNITASYNRLFLKKLLIQKKCFSCRYKTLDRYTDLTIGDFWGISHIMPAIEAKNGVSLVLVSTKKGQLLLDKINEGILLSECEDTQFLNYQNNLVSNPEIPHNYSQFWRNYDEYGIEYILKKYADGGCKGKIVYVIRRIVRVLREKAGIR